MSIIFNAVRASLGLAVLAALSACGDGGSSTPPVTAQSVTPADGSTQVDIRPVIQVAFSGALDPASVTSAHVLLTSTGFTIPATLAYDATSHTISVTPRTLAHDATYTLSLSGLSDPDGNVVADAQAAFSTWVNAVASSTTAASISTATLDATGHPTRLTTTDLAGNVEVYSSYEYVDGRESLRTDWSGPGADGVWFTADDVAQATVRNTYDAAGALDSTQTSYLAIGTNYDPGTTVTQAYQYDATGNVVQTATTVATNTDAGAVTNTSYVLSAYDASGQFLYSYDSEGAGADGLLGTLDDIEIAVIFAPGADGAPDRLNSYQSAGADQDWLTTDDDGGVFTYIEQTRDARGNLVLSVDSGGALPSGGSTTALTYDTHDNLVSTSRGGPFQGETITTYDTSH